MKKLSPVLCAVLLGGCISLAACSGAVVSGNYREPTASELDDALSSIDDAHLFGDPLDSARSYGITVSGEVSGSFNSIAQSSTSEEKLDYSISASGNTLAGEGTYSRSEESLGVTTDIQANFTTTATIFTLITKPAIRRRMPNTSTPYSFRSIFPSCSKPSAAGSFRPVLHLRTRT